MLDEHVEYARYFQDVLGCRIVPLWGIRDALGVGGARSCRCPLSVECGSNAGKHAVGRWKDAPSQLPNRLQNWGYVSDHLVVVDLDTINAEIPWNLPPTWEISTRKGKHLIFRWDGPPLATRIRVVPDVDLKAHGGLVVGPGSKRLDGGTYEPANTLPIAELPQCVVEATSMWHEAERIENASINMRTSPFAMDTVTEMCDEMRSLTTGSRNTKFFGGVCWLLRSGWAGHDAINLYREAAMESGLTEHEVSNAYLSAWRSVFGA